MGTRVFTFKIDDELRVLLQRYAEMNRMTMSEVIREAIREYLAVRYVMIEEDCDKTQQVQDRDNRTILVDIGLDEDTV